MDHVKHTPFSVILAAGGIGSRMGTEIPKQYLPVHNKPLVLYSFELFLSMPEVEEIVVVCEEKYNYLFQSKEHKKKVSFALPGERRQDSVSNGLQALNPCSLVCIHDVARPCIDVKLVRRVVDEADAYGAAVIGVPVKSTIKICDSQQMVLSTPQRSTLWEMQTPQIIRFEILEEAYNKLRTENKTVTDDVSLVELLDKPVKVVSGSYKNIKVTTPEDFIFVEKLLENYVLL